MTVTAPVAMGYIPLGIVFGFLFVQAGAAWWLAILTSLFVYAGAAQFMMIPMIAAAVPIGAIALATLIVNLRHIFYGLSLLNQFPRTPLARWYMVFGLTDETYSVLTSLRNTSSTRQMVLITLLNHGWWVLGTAIGALLGAQAEVPLKGLDFALSALFAVLAVEQWRSRTSPLPLWVAIVSYVIACILAPAHALVLAITLSIAAGVVTQRMQAKARK
jgi:4-azaleucine resistance transporter AzlC